MMLYVCHLLKILKGYFSHKNSIEKVHLEKYVLFYTWSHSNTKLQGIYVADQAEKFTKNHIVVEKGTNGFKHGFQRFLQIL